MGNGMEGDIREIRAEVVKIGKEGCGHRTGHDESIRNLWSAIGKEKTAREAWTLKVVILVVSIVVGAMLANVYATSAVVKNVMEQVLEAQGHGVVLPKR